MKTMKVEDYVRLHPDEFPSLAEFFGVKQSTSVVQQSTAIERKTIAEFDFDNKEIRLMKTNPIYKDAYKYNKIADMYKAIWSKQIPVIRSNKLCAITFKTSFFGEKIKKMIVYCEMRGIVIDIIVPLDSEKKHFTKLHSSREYTVWSEEQQIMKDEDAVSDEVLIHINRYAPELKCFTKNIDLLIEVLKSQIRLSDYDANINSIFSRDLKNNGKIDDSKGIREWSRDHNKHKDANSIQRYGENFDQAVIDLLNTYISCKYYKQIGLAPESKDGIGRNDIDSYTGSSLTTTTPDDLIRRVRMVTLSKMEDPHTYSGINMIPSIATLDAIEEDAELYSNVYNMYIEEPFIKDHKDEEIVVPRSACGLYVQHLMN